jgi:2'-5' RNA ligase
VTRAFVAVAPPDAVLDAVATATEDFELEDGRRTMRAQWHVTLQFLGNAADIDAVAAVLAGLATTRGRARLGGAGAFPSARRATVLWLGLTEGADLLTTLAGEVARRLGPLGFQPEKRPFHPHLTLGRTKAPRDLRGTVDRLAPRDYGPAWNVDEVIVYESRLRRTGAEYVPRAAVTLPS